ncbi:MAG TPA: class I SAM-dependent methyltransferase [Reyranella sp.]|nr:class I SAM-dependent methyltransferase [Reyranella sp.]
MSGLVNKAFVLLKEKGLAATLRKTFIYLLDRLKVLYFEKRVRGLDSAEDRFTAIYRINYWGNAESVSGGSSTLESTANLREGLPRLFEAFSVKSIFDAPCGDFNWMRHVLEGRDLDYVGGDIVKPLIDRNNARFANRRVRFIQVDITRDDFPAVDLMICRDCLFHLSYADTIAALRNIVRANIPYLLTTTHMNDGLLRNSDIRTGDYREIDLFQAPYSFPKDALFRIGEDPKRLRVREMCLWDKRQVAEALAAFEAQTRP